MLPILRIAARSVARNRRRSLITLAAIFLGVGMMLVARGALNGFQASVREEAILGQMGALQVHRAGYMKAVLVAPLQMDLPADEGFLAKIRAVPHVKAAAARILFGGMVNVGDTTVFAILTALDPNAEYQVCPRRARALAEGKLLGPDDAQGAVFSRELAARLGLSLGGQGAILSADRDGVLNGADVHMGGVLGSSGMPQPDTKLAHLPLAAAQELLRMPGRATEIAVAVDDIVNLEAARAGIAQALGPEYEVSTWHDFASVIDDVIGIQNSVLSVISGIFLFVALLGIANTMLMSVLERTREIGTMMAVGVRRRQILSMFLSESVVLALGGSILGAGVAALIVRWMNRAELHLAGPGGGEVYLDPFLTLPYVLLIIGVASIGSALAALYPAWKASRMRPVEALTHT